METSPLVSFRLPSLPTHQLHLTQPRHCFHLLFASPPPDGYKIVFVDNEDFLNEREEKK